jgi:hypothetical protein
MTADTALPAREARARLERKHKRERELAELDRLMREPGSLASSDEPPPLHGMGRDTTTERTTSS